MRHQRSMPSRAAAGIGAGLLLLTSGLVAGCPTQPSPMPAAGRVYVTNELDNTLSVIEARTNKVIATVSAGTAPEGIAVSPRHSHRLYIADNGSGRVSVL